MDSISDIVGQLGVILRSRVEFETKSFSRWQDLSAGIYYVARVANWLELLNAAPKTAEEAAALAPLMEKAAATVLKRSDITIELFVEATNGFNEGALGIRPTRTVDAAVQELGLIGLTQRKYQSNLREDWLILAGSMYYLARLAIWLAETKNQNWNDDDAAKLNPIQEVIAEYVRRRTHFATRLHENIKQHGHSIREINSNDSDIWESVSRAYDKWIDEDEDEDGNPPEQLDPDIDENHMWHEKELEEMEEEAKGMYPPREEDDGGGS